MTEIEKSTGNKERQRSDYDENDLDDKEKIISLIEESATKIITSYKFFYIFC